MKYIIFYALMMLYDLWRQVFFSGCLHGDEQVGPTTVVETAKLMVYGAMCQADPAAKVTQYPPPLRPCTIKTTAMVHITPPGDNIGVLKTLSHGMVYSRGVIYNLQPGHSQADPAAKVGNPRACRNTSGMTPIYDGVYGTPGDNIWGFKNTITRCGMLYRGCGG